MAAEPISEQVAEGFLSRLAAIDPGVDSAYWYKPSKVVRADIALSTTIKNATYEQIGLITPGDEYVMEDTSHSLNHYMDIFVTCAKKWSVGTPDPFMRVNDPLRWTYQNRMAGDVIKAIMADVQFGGIIDNAACRIDISRDFDDPEGWAIVVMRFQVLFDQFVR